MPESAPEDELQIFESKIPSTRLAEHLQHLRQLLRLTNTVAPHYVHKTELLIDDVVSDLEHRGKIDLTKPEGTDPTIEGARSVRLG